MQRKPISNKIKQRQIQTNMLQNQTKKMQQKLSLLKQQVQQQKQLKASSNYQSTISRWRKATNSDAPLKDYAKKILHDQKQAYNKYGINQKKITGTKSFQPVISKMKQQKQQNEEKSGIKIPKLNDTQKKQQLPVTSIQDNFFKAKIQTKNLIKRKTLDQFMEENFLHQYLPALKNAGIKQLQDLYHTKRQEMTQLGIKPGHQVKILKNLKIELEGKNQQQKQKQQKKTQQSSKQKVSFGYGDGDINEYKKIQQQEERQKQKQKQQFQNFNQINEDQESEDAQSEYDDQVAMITIPNFAQTSLQTGQKQDNQDEFKQYNCFQCYKKGLNCPKVSSDSRLFCSNNCLNKYLDYMQKICPQCDSHFYKFDGYFQDGLWFCSINCSPKRQEMQQMFLEWAKNKQ